MSLTVLCFCLSLCSRLLSVFACSMLLPPVIGSFLSFPFQCFCRPLFLSPSCLCLLMLLHARAPGVWLSLSGRISLFNVSACLCSRHSPITACSMHLPHPVPAVSLLGLHHLFNASTSRVHVYFLPLSLCYYMSCSCLLPVSSVQCFFLRLL